MLSEPIYKRDSVGNIRTWQYEVKGDSFRSISGLIDGQKVASGWTVCTPKSQDTAEEQAQFEAQAEERKKLEREYHKGILDIDTPNFFKPMLAQTYEKVTFPVYSQPKLDGIRCIATAKGLFTRQGKRIFGAPHIEAALKFVFDRHPGLILDGELYNHDLKDDFNQIVSMVRKQNLSAAEIEQSAALIEYHVYDIPSVQEDFWPRSQYVRQLVDVIDDSTIKLVPTHRADTLGELDGLYGLYAEQGYEGQMVRLDKPYEQKRSKSLLKRKEFQDREFEIVVIEEGLGNWAGYAKRVVCKLDDGREFGAGIKGNQAFTRDLLGRREEFVGKQATIKFFEFTPDGVPRFPVAINFARID